MIDDQARALAIVAALLSGLSGSAGFVGGRMTVPEAEPEIRFVHVPMPALPPPEIALIEPAPQPAPVPRVQSAPLPPVSSQPEMIPLPQPRPKAETKPKETHKPKPESHAAKKPRAAKRSLPSCTTIKREYEAMSWPERMAAYRKATPEEIAQGKRCLGF